MAEAKPEASKTAQDIVSSGERLASSPADIGARDALMRDSGYLVNDKGYRDQVLAEVRKLGVSSVENRANSGLGFSFYGSNESPMLEIMKDLPGTNPSST